MLSTVGRATTVALLLGGVAACGSGGGRDPRADRLADAEAANRRVLAVPVCDAIDAGLLAEVAPGIDRGEATHDPIASSCTWQASGRSVVLSTGVHTSLNAPLFDQGDAEPIPLDDPRVRRAAVVDDRGAPGTSALMIELVDDGGYLDLCIDGLDAAEQARRYAVPIAEDLLDDLAR